MSRRTLLLINPNTSAAVTGLLQRQVRAVAGPGVRVRASTARFGTPYIVDEASYAVAGHATLDAWAAALREPAPAPDAVLIGCFGDPGLMALRHSSPVPVTGLAEAAFMRAARHGRFAIVTGGECWASILERLALSLGHADSLAGIRTLNASGAQLASDPVAARELVARACIDAAEQFAAQAIIVGGAALGGIAADIQHCCAVPLVDSVIAGAHWALREHPAPSERRQAGFDVPWVNLSAEMTALGRSADRT